MNAFNGIVFFVAVCNSRLCWQYAGSWRPVLLDDVARAMGVSRRGFSKPSKQTIKEKSQ